MIHFAKWFVICSKEKQAVDKAGQWNLTGSLHLAAFKSIRVWVQQRKRASWALQNGILVTNSGECPSTQQASYSAPDGSREAQLQIRAGLNVVANAD